MGANHVRREQIPPNLAQTSKNDEKYTEQKNSLFKPSNKAFFQNSNSGGVRWTHGGVTKYQF